MPANRSDLLEAELPVARVLAAARFVSIADVTAATGLEPFEAFALLREFTRRGFAVAQAAGSPGCHGRKDGPQFLYSPTEALATALRAVGRDSSA